MTTTHIRFGGRRRNERRERAQDLEVSRVAAEDRKSMDVDDAFTERLDACTHGHMYVCDGAKAVTNPYRDDPCKDPRTYIVRRIRISYGAGRGTEHQYSCQCRDFKFRCLPKAPKDVRNSTAEGEAPPDPMDVPPYELEQVLRNYKKDCKHIIAARADRKAWQ